MELKQKIQKQLKKVEAITQSDKKEIESNNLLPIWFELPTLYNS
jgi:hypothetical protein